MNKSIILFILLNLLYFSSQLECNSYNDNTCGRHNTNYKLKCRKNGSKCEEIEIDDGCEINTSNECVKTNSVPDSENCFGDDLLCKRMKNICSNNHDKAKCDTFNTNDKQCIKFNNIYNCKEISIDEYCKVDNAKNCVNKVELTSEYICSYNSGSTECKRRNKICSDNTDDCSSFSNTCYKISGLSYCKEVSINDKCKIIDGDCKINTDNNNANSKIEKCEFNDEKTQCNPRTLNCEELSNSDCSLWSPTSNNKKCLQLNINSRDICKEIEVDSACEIKNEDNSCQIKDTNSKNICQYNNEYSKCQLIEIEDNCKINSGVCTEDDTVTPYPEGKKCKFNDAYTKCRFIDKTCEDYKSSADCEKIVKSNNIKCSYDSSQCSEYTIDSYCTVTGGKCVPKEGVTIQDNEECLFGLDGKCGKKEKKCTNYYTKDKCDTYDTDNTKCILLNSYEYCKEITVNKDCTITENRQCTEKNGATFDQKKGKCAYNDVENIQSCDIKPRKCKEYTIQTCDGTQTCAYYSLNQICYETDNYCTINTNNECVAKEGVELANKEKCYLDTYNHECKKTEKNCEEYTKEECNSVQKTNDKQCFVFSGQSTCKSVYLDGNCYIDDEGKCIPQGSLSDNEICAFDSDNYKTYCRKREKQCSDLNDETCESYTPLTKLCFKFDNEDTCKEVKIDNGCSINDENKCVGQNCVFDTQKDKCYKKEDNGSLLNTKSFILSLLLLILF